MKSNHESHQVRLSVFSKDFTKRQRSIINFIGMLSKGKETAIIPFLKDFSLCGIGQNKIKDELTQLERKNVILWNRETNEYRINPSVSEWEIPDNKYWDKERFYKLLRLNQ